jgi:hypothetical protein
MTEAYDRESQLQNRLNSFLEQEFRLPEGDYYERLSLDGFLGMKSLLGDINNIFTLKVTLAFSEWVSNHLALNDTAKQDIISQIQKTKPNANGYDIEVSGPVKIIAEVKCNVPVNGGNVYGSAQKDGIAKDINSLIKGKSKSAIEPEGYLKFMVFLDLPEILKATNNFVKNMKENRERIVLLGNNSIADDTSKVYVVYVGF